MTTLAGYPVPERPQATAEVQHSGLAACRWAKASPLVYAQPVHVL